MSIILYDIPSSLARKAWTYNVWKARFSLNYKGIPYTTHWIEFPDIEPTFKKLGVPPSSTQPDGSPYYTVPTIYDPSTGVYVSDSILIADYLDKTYPDKPLLFPSGTFGIQSAFNDGFFYHIKAVVPAMIPTILSNLHDVSSTYMVNKHGSLPPKPTFEDYWHSFKQGLDQIDTWYARNGDKGTFLFGDSPSWADIVVASVLVYVKIVFGEASREWREVESWNNGRWKELSGYFSAYETVI
ncbi:Glutathione S-transferase-like protein ustS [Psilocybe cubensis]|uniref:GST N-terminal domain-containing protein n=2 Tax=Psilocybe cubensis TaxID=181762 RepID=A0A8H8CG53_PSICU|nr:Glutathione S-transferase-like protein ustS [Psilocybe cubensis]KAH9480873.1 Glutathione S-transferase-like protein ustS [Psilocybe cubensis]